MLPEDVQTSSGVVESKTEAPPSLAAVMVHVDLDHDCEPRIELASGDHALFNPGIRLRRLDRS